jgi:hypothetical protein
MRDGSFLLSGARGRELRYRAAILVIFAVLLPPAVMAQSTPVSTIRLAHPVLISGQTQVVTVTARDLKGHPLPGARARAQVQIGVHRASYGMRATNRLGVTTLIMHPPRTRTRVRVVVRISVTNGFISIPLSASFEIVPAGATVTPT